MKLLKIGNKYINMELVTDISAGGDYIDVFFITPVQRDPGVIRSMGSSSGARALRFEGNEAQFLQNWLDQNAEDLSQ